ncbi:DUF3540 domain-containing protein [Sorangium sp. So ce281]|uniref:DUF3540 domain-containing protein n=1 Tax=unclassified Sorangium TaxID=2621164 RepID=UPI003F631966
MSQRATAEVITPDFPRAETETLGPAEVLSIEAGDVLVVLSNGAERYATMAFVSPYEPAVGDVLLVIGKRDDLYAIGVLRGSGRAVLRFSGDVDLAAEGGTLRLSADRGVEIRSPEVTVHASRVTTWAETLIQRATNLYQRVASMLEVEAKEARTVVAGSSVLQARTATIVTDETATVQGKQVHLG